VAIAVHGQDVAEARDVADLVRLRWAEDEKRSSRTRAPRRARALRSRICQQVARGLGVEDCDGCSRGVDSPRNSAPSRRERGGSAGRPRKDDGALVEDRQEARIERGYPALQVRRTPWLARGRALS